MAFLQKRYKVTLDNFFQYNMSTYLCNTHVHICIVDERSSDHRPIDCLPTSEMSLNCRPIEGGLSPDFQNVIRL